MRKQSTPSQRDRDPESIKRRTELFTINVLPHKGMIYDIAIKYTRDKKHIEDNYSDVMVTIFRYIESYNPQRDIKSWIYAVATRMIFDANKRNGRIAINNNKRVEEIPENIEESGVTFRSLTIENYREHYNDTILEALDNLSPVHREALLLQQAGYKVDEIADIAFQKGTLQSKSSETIKSRIYLAKKSMQKLITVNGEKRYEQK